MNQNLKQMSKSTVNVLTSLNLNDTSKKELIGRTDLHNTCKQQTYGPVIRTPGHQKLAINSNNQLQSKFLPSGQFLNNFNEKNQNNSNQRSFDISSTVTSIVDNWEADLAKQVKRRPSGQFESCKYIINITFYFHTGNTRFYSPVRNQSKKKYLWSGTVFFFC